MEKNVREVEKAYDKIARWYHEKRTKLEDVNYFIEVPTSLGLLGNVKGKKILDAGCGSGIYAKILAKKGAKVYGIELSKEMLACAKDYCKGYDIEFKQGSIENLTYPDNYFDSVLCSLAIHYLKDTKKAFSEFSRVLKKGGFLVFSTANPTFEAKYEVKREKGKNILSIANYFNPKKYYWRMYQSQTDIPSYPLPFEKLFDNLYKSNLMVEKFKEPYMKYSDKKIPKHLKKWAEIPTFMVLKCKKIK